MRQYIVRRSRQLNHCIALHCIAVVGDHFNEPGDYFIKLSKKKYFCLNGLSH